MFLTMSASRAASRADGPRAVGELLREIAAERAIYHIVNRKLARYAALSPEALAMTGGDRFPPVPIYGVPST